MTTATPAAPNAPESADPRLAARAAIADVLTGWIYRDTEDWPRLAALFHSGATLDISWFRGSAPDFIAASRAMAGAGAYRSKHVIAAPCITFAGPRALVETNAVMFIESRALRLGVEQHFRFIDRMSERPSEQADEQTGGQAGGWAIDHRDAVYDMGWFIYPQGTALADPIDPALMQQQPDGYAPMAYLNARAGRPLERPAATRGSALEAAIRARGAAWLAGEAVLSNP